jgi:hypothetical protein
MRHGGVVYWARRTGTPYVRAPLPDNWSEQRVANELGAYLEGRTAWPTEKEFGAAGHKVLREAVRATGGPERWAPRFGIELPPSRARKGRWTYDRMKDEVAALAGDSTKWPRCVEFQRAGLPSLYQATMRAGVREALAAELGLEPPQRRKQLTLRLTNAQIQTCLDDFLEGRESFPRRHEFYEAGLLGMYDHIYNSGRREAWARRYGLPVHRRAKGTH